MTGPFSKILVPVDGSSNSMRVGNFGLELAKAYGMHVIALYVIDEPPAASPPGAAKGEMPGLEANLLREGKNCLHALQLRAEEEGVDFVGLIKEGKAHRIIVAVADEEDVDLILIGKVGQRGPRRILIGSVTERVLEGATCPVLVVKLAQ